MKIGRTAPGTRERRRKGPGGASAAGAAAGRHPTNRLYGNIQGLKPNQTKRIQHVYRRKIPPHQIVTPELSRYIGALSHETGRQIGVLVNRKGQIEYVVVGDARAIFLPEFGRLRAGERRFRGLRFIHTHLKNEPLTRDDLTDLSLLRLDLVAAIGLDADGLPLAARVAHLLPRPAGGNGRPLADADRAGAYRFLDPVHPSRLDIDFIDLIRNLEEEFARVHGPRAAAGRAEKAVLVKVRTGGTVAGAEAELAELRELAHASGVEVVDSFTQVRPRFDPKTLIGKGKLDDLTIRATQVGADLVIVDQNLTPAQGREMAAATGLRVIDRTQLILDIFGQRARSSDGKVQVELAHLKYMLPRLGQRDDALSRLTGGIGARGPGETRLEVDRRRIRDRIARLERDIRTLSRGRAQRRARRKRRDLPIISIVGYTNAGKSTLLNALTDSRTPVADRLFATLDPASKRLRFPREQEAIITDTVGFIRDLPKDLLAAFRATLEELSDADLLLHVADVSSPRFESQRDAVVRILEDLSLADIPRLLVLNKTDAADPIAVRHLAARHGAVPVSAIDAGTLPPLVGRIQGILWRERAASPAARAGRA
ncbi:MAG: GTPase HflX [Myxococcota bacterium]